MRSLYWTCAMIGAILLPASAVLTTGTPEASAATAYEYCFYQDVGIASCLNAWGGGPFVNVENDDGSNDPNDLFEVTAGSAGNVVLQFDGVGIPESASVTHTTNPQMPGLPLTRAEAAARVPDGALNSRKFT